MTPELVGLPPTIGRYELRGLLGRGGMGRVVRAHDPVLKRDVAVKLVEIPAVEPAALAEVRYLFHREARATAALKHANVVEIYDYSGPEAELPFLVCELIEAPTLREVLEQRQGGLPPRVVAALGYELALALAHAHERGIVHRDVKPENVFWTPGGRAVLADFGIAKAFTGPHRLGASVQYGATNLYGSPCTMAPEQVAGGEVGPAADLYALGAVLFEALTGAPAFEGESVHALLDNVVNGRRALRVLPSTAPATLTRLLDELLARDPTARPTDVAQRLRDVLDELEVSDPRLYLRDHGTAEDAHDMGPAPLEDEEETEPFASSPPHGIRLPRGAARQQTWRGPALFTVLGVAIAGGVGALGLRAIGEPGPEPRSATPATTPQAGAAAEDVFVLLRFTGEGTVLVDGYEVGTWSERVRLALPPGKHRLEVRTSAGRTSKDVLLLTGTEPVFDLQIGQGAE